MADYTRRDGSAMRTDAQRRARQMQQRVPGRTRTDRQKENISSEEENADENNAKNPSEINPIYLRLAQPDRGV